jgi:hypothetical protein
MGCESHLMNNKLKSNDLGFMYTFKQVDHQGLIFVKLATFMLNHSHRIVKFHNIAV